MLAKSAACMRSEMRSKGLTFNLHMEHGKHCFSTSFNVNHFKISGDEQGSRRSPIQVISHRDVSMPVCSAFGSVVYAKVLDSVETPEKTRFISVAYNRISLSQQSHEVVSLIFGEVVYISELKSKSWIVCYGMLIFGLMCWYPSGL